jgi:hypothetical protein
MESEKDTTSEKDRPGVTRRVKKVYFIGIGGIGMSAIARFMKPRARRSRDPTSTPSQVTRGWKRWHRHQLSPGGGEYHRRHRFGGLYPVHPRDQPGALRVRAKGILAVTYSHRWDCIQRQARHRHLRDARQVHDFGHGGRRAGGRRPRPLGVGGSIGPATAEPAGGEASTSWRKPANTAATS